MKSQSKLVKSLLMIITLLLTFSQGIEALELRIDTPNTRLLVIAPHPDDETLSSSILMKRILDAGGEVMVVFITNGDAYRNAAKTYFKKAFVRPIDYLLLGTIRQEEALNALSIINIAAENIVFLGYPDGGLHDLFYENWDIDDKYRAKTTWLDRNVYANSYELGAYYCGENLLENLKDIIIKFNPNVVVYPDVHDQNGDHSAVNLFVERALTEVDYGASRLTYLIHYKAWPIIMNSTITSDSLIMPTQIDGGEEGWLELHLTPEETILAASMLLCYQSQLNAIFKLNIMYLYSFVRTNQIFRVVEAK